MYDFDIDLELMAVEEYPDLSETVVAAELRAREWRSLSRFGEQYLEAE